MKKAILFALLLISIKSFSQSDAVTVKLPVKAIVLYGDYLSKFYLNWDERKTPDALLPLIGSGTQPDSVVNVTTSGAKLSNFIIQLLQYDYGTIATTARSILSNSPSIPGYTALTTQITTIANGNTSQKAAAQSIITNYTAFTQSQTDKYNSMYNNGIYFIQH